MKLARRFDDLLMVRRFALACRPGAYLRIVTEGEIGAGDAITVTTRPEHGITIAHVAPGRCCSTTACSSPPPPRPSCRRGSRAGCASAPRRSRSDESAGAAGSTTLESPT